MNLNNVVLDLDNVPKIKQWTITLVILQNDFDNWQNLLNIFITVWTINAEVNKDQLL